MLPPSYSVLRRIIQDYILPYKKLAIYGIIANICIAGTGALYPWFIQQIIDNAFLDDNTPKIIIISMGLLLSGIIKGISTYVVNINLSIIGQYFTAKLQTQLITSILTQDTLLTTKQHSGNYLSLFLNDTHYLRDTVVKSIMTITRQFLSIILILTVMFYMNWYLSLIYFILVMPIGVFFMVRWIRQSRIITQQHLRRTDTLSTAISESLQGIKTIKAYRQEERQKQYIIAIINSITQSMIQFIKLKMRAGPTIEVLITFALVVTILWLQFHSAEIPISPGRFVGFLTAFLLLRDPMRNISQLPVDMRQSISAAQRIFTVVDASPTIQINDKNNKPVQYTKTHIKFNQVNFQYSDQQENPLYNINMQIPPQQTIGLVGPSGSGKSTIINLLLRFSEPDSGFIEINGQNIQNMTLNDLRSHIALVTQDIFLFDDTIRNNITFGDTDIPQSEIEKATKLADAHEFISSFPEGYDTYCGESGIRLSGGQKQRIAITRAIIKKAPILIFDEATSSIDTKSEKKIQESLHRLMKNHTCIIISHRLSTIMNADYIYVLDQGHIVESGTHDTLLKNNNLYTQLYNAQF